MTIQDFGYKGELSPEIARVTAVHRERYELITAEQFTFGRLKSAVYYQAAAPSFPTVGDYVRIAPNPSGDALILDTLPRSSFFSRNDPTPGRGEQAVAANFDTVFLVSSLNRDCNLRRMERYLTLARRSGAQVVIVLTKADLPEADAGTAELVRAIAGDIPVCPVSVVSDQGFDALKPYLQPGQTLVLLGSSGVGKSSLVNYLAGEELMRVNATRDVDAAKGRHTTTHRQLLRLTSGVLIIDTPGMRELGMSDAGDGLQSSFPDVESHLGRCRFRDCTHGSEPGCAIRHAIETGLLAQERWDNYCQLQRESQAFQTKAEMLREKQARNRSIAIKSRDIKKRRKFDL